MHVDKSEITEALRARGQHDRAQQAECALPREVDTDREAALLHRFEVDAADLEDASQTDGQD
ncbi:MAG TPA: hypothetical protein VFJ19_16760 [Nocardioidaceae bacterium]|nr:hypothetical protein [Nocardioidaceae bacterium]